MDESCLACKWVMSHFSTTHGAHRIIFLTFTREYVTSYIWMSRVWDMNKSCVRYEWVATYEWCHIQMRCVSDVNESCIWNQSCVTYERVVCQIWMSRHIWMMAHTNEVCIRCECVVHMSQSRVTYERVVCQIWMSHVSRVNESCLTSLRRIARIRTSSWHSHGHTSCHAYECVVCTYEWVMSHIWMSRVSHMNESCVTYEWVVCRIWMSHVSSMGWLRLVGSLKL